MIRTMFRVGKWLFISLVVLIVLIFLLSVGLLYTETGLRIATWGAEKALPELTIGEANGVLGNEFSLNRVEYHQTEPALDLSVETLSLALEAKCLFQPAICIDSVQATGVAFSMPTVPESSEEETPTEPAKVINAPLPIRIDGLELNNIALSVLGNEIEWKQFSTGIEWRRNKLTVTNTDWTDIDIRLASSNAAESTSTPTTEESAGIVLPEVWIPLNIDIPRFNIERFTLHQETPVVVNQFTLAAQAFENDIKIIALDLDMPEANVALNGEASLKDNYPLEIQLSSTVKLDQAKGQTAKAQLSGSLEVLDIKLALGGLVTGDVEGQLQPLDSTLPFDVTINKLKGQWPLISESADFEAYIANAEAKGALESFTLQVQGDVSGKTIPDTALVLQGKGSQTDIDLSKFYVETLGGNVNGRVKASWGDVTNIATDLTLTKIQPDKYWPEVPGLINGHIVATASAGGNDVWRTHVSTLDIQGELLDYPLNINGVVDGFQRKADGPIQVSTSGLTLAHGDNKVYASGRLANQWDMNVALTIPELGKSVPDTAGTVMGTIQLRGDVEQPLINLDLTANDIEWQDQLKVVSTTLKGKAQPLPKPSVDVRLAVTELDFQTQHVDQIDLQVNGDAAKHTVSLATEAPWGNTELDVVGQLNKEMTKWAGSLNQFVLTSDPNRFYLESPTAIEANITEQNVTVDAHCWRESDASLCLKQRSTFSAEEAKVDLALSDFNFEQIRHFIPQDTQVSGEASADISLEYQQGLDPKLDAKVQLAKGQVIQALAEPVTVGWEQIDLQINVADNQLVSTALVDLTENGELTLNANVSDITAEDKAIDGQLSITKVTLEALGPLLGEYGKANAEINSELDLKGTLLHPQAFGQFTISDIVAQGEITPVDINNGQLSLNFAGYQADLIASLITEDGKLNIEGDANWQEIEQWSVNSHVFANELEIKVPPMVDIKASPDLRLSMAPNKASVEGDIDLPWGKIIVEELPASATKVSSDQVIVNESLQPINEDTSLPFELNTNVRINIGDEFSLEAFGLKGNLTGLLNVTQRDSAPFVTGEVNIVDGTYRSFGQDLVIKKGQIVMHGPVDQPYVAITAIRNPDNIEDEVEAGIKVTGSADSPSVEVYSDPAMGQANALSYLLRGQDLDAESGDNSMTTALIGLSLAQSGKVVGEIGQAFGVDDLQLDTTGSGDDSQVTVSGYVLPGLQVKYGVGIFTSVGEFTLRYRLMKNLYVEAVSGLTSAVDLLYQFEFN